jgi:hypothetical protein
MKLDDVVSVSRLPGLYKLVATRQNGLLIESFETQKRQFVSIRKHQFTPLVSIGIYTYTDVINIDDVFKKVDDARTAHPIPNHNAKADELRLWFKAIVADHDEDRVHINDIRKVIRWYSFLKLHAWDMIHQTDEEE